MDKEALLKEYLKLNVSLDILKLVNHELKITEKRLTLCAMNRRLEAVNEAIGWRKGKGQDNRVEKVLYIVGNNSIAIAKPGKEAAPEYKGCKNYVTGEKTNNPNDMLPIIYVNFKKLENNLDFTKMFDKLETLIRADLFSLELLGMVLFRAAFMIDHYKDKEGHWRFKPLDKIIVLINAKIPFITDMPTELFLYFLEVLGLNEDVKMYTLGHNNFKEDYGRVNTLLTLSHLISVFLGKRSISKFAGALTRPPIGVAPLPKTKVFEYYPLLDPLLF